MNEEISIMPIVVGALAVLYFGYEVERRRHQLRETLQRLRQTGKYDRTGARSAWSRAASSGRMSRARLAATGRVHGPVDIHAMIVRQKAAGF